MHLYLLRHAEAEPHRTDDFTRALTERGIAQARKAGKFCERNDIVPELLLTSPLMRAEQTARLAAEEAGIKNVEVAPFLASGMDPEVGAAELSAYKKLGSVMIAGHEPDFSRLAAFLLGLPAGNRIHLRKGSLTLLDVRALTKGAAVLEFSLPVKLMR